MLAAEFSDNAYHMCWVAQELARTRIGASKQGSEQLALRCQAEAACQAWWHAGEAAVEGQAGQLLDTGQARQGQHTPRFCLTRLRATACLFASLATRALLD